VKTFVILAKRGEKMSAQQKNVVVLSVGTTGSRVASEIRKNAKTLRLLSLSFVGIGLDTDEKKFEELELDKKIFFHEEFSLGRFMAGVVSGMGKKLPEVEETVKNADYVLVLSAEQTRSWMAASTVMEMLEKKRIIFSILSKDSFPLRLMYAGPLAFKYCSKAISFLATSLDSVLHKELAKEESVLYENSIWQSMAEAALDAICFPKGESAGSNLFEEIFLDGERVWFMYGSASGNGRADVALKQVKKHLKDDETMFDKVYLYLKADNLLEEEVQTVKEEIAQCLKNSELIVAVSKTNSSEGFLTISLFRRAKC